VLANSGKIGNTSRVYGLQGLRVLESLVQPM